MAFLIRFRGVLLKITWIYLVTRMAESVSDKSFPISISIMAFLYDGSCLSICLSDVLDEQNFLFSFYSLCFLSLSKEKQKLFKRYFILSWFVDTLEEISLCFYLKKERMTPQRLPIFIYLSSITQNDAF